MEAEAEIVARCKKGDRAAQAAVFKEYAGLMLSICRRYAGNNEDARDLLHDGFIKVFNKIDSFRQDSSLKTWLSVIFVNTSLTFLKKRMKQQYFNIEDAEEKGYMQDAAQNEGPSLDEEFGVSAEEAMAMVQELPDKYRIVVNLYCIEGCGHKDIAEMLDMPVGTSKARLSRARVMLATSLAQKKRSYEEAYK